MQHTHRHKDHTRSSDCALSTASLSDRLYLINTEGTVLDTAPFMTMDEWFDLNTITERAIIVPILTTVRHNICSSCS